MNNNSPPPREWKIGLSAWIIQDGNYGDFEEGQTAEFALEFFPKRIQPTSIRKKSAKNLGAAGYDVVGEVVYLMPEVWVLDFGICAFQESKPPEEMALAGTIQIEKGDTVWRACGDETKTSSRASTGGGPNGAPAN